MAVTKPKYKQLKCCCCGGSAYGEQFWNQDTGYGLGDCCVETVSQNTTQEWVEQAYGKAGINYLVTKVKNAKK